MKYIAYYRVSTTKQGDSGLGLEAQQATVKSFLSGHTPYLEFTEVESGRKTNRPQLEMALIACKLHGATLIIAKLDRLARNVHFVSGLMESDVEFVACDHPHANRMVLHMMAAVAEYESELISQRTKAALKAAKARGVVLGTHGKRLQKRARKFAESLRDVFEDFQESGLTYRQMANALENMNIPAFSGTSWNATSVMRTLKRLEQ